MRQRRVTHAVRVLLSAAALSGLVACAEKAFAPGDAGSGLVRLSVVANISQQLKPVTRTVAMKVGYRRAAGAFMPLAEESIEVTSGDSVPVSLVADVTSCLSDPTHEGAANVCRLLVLVTLRDASGTTLDSATAGPIDAAPGTTPGTLTVTMAAVASVTMAPPGPDTLQTGATLQLSATAADAAGSTLDGRAVSWTSGSPSVATVSPTGLVTAVAVGADTISATIGGIRGTVALIVRVPTPTSTFALAWDRGSWDSANWQ